MERNDQDERRYIEMLERNEQAREDYRHNLKGGSE
jgi:hypothetical protein